jgi:hypothetical protein
VYQHIFLWLFAARNIKQAKISKRHYLTWVLPSSYLGEYLKIFGFLTFEKKSKRRKNILAQIIFDDFRIFSLYIWLLACVTGREFDAVARRSSSRLVTIS